VMHHGIPYDPIQGQGLTGPLKFRKLHFSNYLLRHLQWELANDH